MELYDGVPRELSALQKKRTLYQPELPPSLQGTSVRAVFGDTTTAVDMYSSSLIKEAFPLTHGQRLAHFLCEAEALPSSQLIRESSVNKCNYWMVRTTLHWVFYIKLLHYRRLIRDLPLLGGQLENSQQVLRLIMGTLREGKHETPRALAFMEEILTIRERVGVVFCGRQAPGGHNVIWGLHDAIRSHNPDSVLLGFVGGTEGLFAQKTIEITDEVLSAYKKSRVTSNNDAAHLAEFFSKIKCSTQVVGVPVTINGDLKNHFVETNVGFDTVCRVNSQLIGNICLDALSAEKYYYFIRLMGHQSSHIAVECALQTHPNMVFLGEEVETSGPTLQNIIKEISDGVQARAEQGKYHGVILIPEGLVESVPELNALLQEIHSLQNEGVTTENISSHLSDKASTLFENLPSFIKKQFLLFPESDNAAQLSQIEMEKLLAHLVDLEMSKRMKEGTYKGKKFSGICHFLGFQTRGALPSQFDCNYAYALGHVCFYILAAGLSGYMAHITNSKNPVNKWKCGAIPITAMMTVNQEFQFPGATAVGKLALHPAKLT
ncbi:hypothetical protein HPP92_003839 [Vanilla planifolia]|uniref:Phosphofructokinase domain-containing protein n=1 Tax=Vanilla planifolia TaxID=51239 RepID=A0A835VJB8_VANPL|nr:hypothetical protein HPP92_003839 [Vanilla planifolia]